MVEQWKNPYENLTLDEIYNGFIDGRFGPMWPSEKIQAGYTGTNKIDLVRRAFSFVDILEKDGAFKDNWKGLDYGCGWGRFASVLLSKGCTDQLDLCDAWQVTLDRIEKLNYKNKIFKVPSLLEKDSIAQDTYDFVMTFSVFTHLSPLSFESNIPVILNSLKDGGKFYLTVRHDEFFDHKYPDKANEYREVLKQDEIVFIDSGGDMMSEKLFGDTIITKKYLEKFGKFEYLGMPHTLQHVYSIKK